jgi:hypothetical protein
MKTPEAWATTARTARLFDRVYKIDHSVSLSMGTLRADLPMTQDSG